MYLNSSRVASVEGWVGEEGGTGGRRRLLNASHSSSLQKARVTEYSGRAVEKKTIILLKWVSTVLYIVRVIIQ